MSKSSKTEKAYDKVYLIDFDNCADTDVKNLRGYIHIFLAKNFNMKSNKIKNIQNLPGVKIHQAKEPLPEIVDHMMTWYACENFKKIKDKEVVVISKDFGLNALISILKQKDVNARLTN